MFYCNFQASIQAERTRQAETLEVALVGTAESVKKLEDQLKASTARQAEAQEVGKRKCELEIEMLERKRKNMPNTPAERDQLMAKLKADLGDMVSKQVMTEEAAAKWYQKEAMVLYGWGD